MLAVLTCFAAIFGLVACDVSAPSNPISGPFRGDLTFYGAGGGNNGACSLGSTNSLNLAWSTSVFSTVALNAPQYGTSVNCGMCIMWRGLNPNCTTCGTASNAITNIWHFGMVADECPECASGALDIALSDDGRWSGEFYFIQCNVGTGKFHYALQGSNEYYIKIQVSNTRYAVAAVSIQAKNGAWFALTRTADNFFQSSGGTGFDIVFPMAVQITSMFGDTVTENVTFTGYAGEYDGTVQFVDKGYDTAGLTISGNSSVTPSPTSNPVNHATSARSHLLASFPLLFLVVMFAGCAHNIFI